MTIMSAFEEKLAFYDQKATEHGLSIPADVLETAAKACGPAIYDADAELVSATDPEELARVVANFVMDEKDLGITDQAAAEAAVEKVAADMADFGARKYRAIFYALLMMHFAK